MAQIDDTEMDYLLTLIRVKTIMAPGEELADKNTTKYYALPDDDDEVNENGA